MNKMVHKSHTNFDIDSIRKNISLYKKKITSFNFTLTTFPKWTEDMYSAYYDYTDIIFCDEILFSFTSPFLTNKYVEISDLDKLMRVYKEHKLTSKKLYKIINK